LGEAATASRVIATDIKRAMITFFMVE